MKIYNNIANIILTYANIFNNHFVLSFNPIKPQLYEIMKKKLMIN